MCNRNVETIKQDIRNIHHVKWSEVKEEYKNRECADADYFDRIERINAEAQAQLRDVDNYYLS